MEQRWIPVEERPPEERDSIFAKWKGTAKWNPAMFEKTSDEVLVTISDVGGGKTTRTAHTLDGKWSCDLLKANASYKVIAWMPLPEPYRGEEPKQTNADRIRSMTDEDAEEQGFLLRLPCGIGADVYIIPSKVNYELNILNQHPENNKVYHQKVALITFTEKGWYMECDKDREYATDRILSEKMYKKIWFLSQEEAEAKLKEMEGSYDGE